MSRSVNLFAQTGMEINCTSKARW